MDRWSLTAALAVSLTACWGAPGHLSFSGEPPGDDEVWRPNSDTGPEDSDEPDPMTGVDPVVQEADAWCYTSSDAGDFWGFSAVGDDPQGSQTLEAYIPDGVEVQDADGDVLATVALVCEDSGQCWGSVQCEHIDVSCSSPQSYSFLFVVQDEQGNRSEAATVQGRYGAGPTG